jgi:hypothetical protein
VKRDLVFEAWGVGDAVQVATTFDDVRRKLVWEAWGVGGETFARRSLDKRPASSY